MLCGVQEIKQFTRVVCVFSDKESCLRLISAILMEVSEKWKYGRLYLRVETSYEIGKKKKGFVVNFLENLLHNQYKFNKYTLLTYPL